jgi:hypothetical protein
LRPNEGAPLEKAMTESEWLLCREPQAMLAALRAAGKLSERNARLFAAACCRRAWHLMVDERSHKAVEVVELFADGEVDGNDLAVAERGAGAAATARRSGASDAAWMASHAAWLSTWDDTWRCAETTLAITRKVMTRDRGKSRPQDQPIYILRDLFGPIPFRPVAIDPGWLTWNGSTVGRLARAAYDGRQMPAGTLEPERLAVLADALEDAGCGDLEVLGHLRESGKVHYRGCWVLDLLLGRSP